MTTLRPPQPVTEQIAELTTVGDLLCLTFREHNEAFRQLARELQFRWNEREWRRERKITATVGTAEDRLVEAAYKLLRAGFCVSVPDEISQERILAGEYVDEHTRWIHKGSGGKYAGWFLVAWSYGEEYYHKARALPGSRYTKPYIAVPAEYFTELEDFAGLYDFRFSAAGQKLLAEAKEKRQQMVRVELRPRKRTALAVTAAQSVIGEIADEFRDEE